jgi:diguanylate cyclase (GGDEF)-like protein
MAFRPRIGTGARLFAGFAALSLLPVLVLGGVLAAQYRNEVQQRGTNQGRSQAEVIARLLGQTQLDGHSLRSGLSAAERQRIWTFADTEVRAGQVSRLRLRAPDQSVIFSDDGSGLDVKLDDEVDEALHGQSVAKVTHLDADSVENGPAGPRVVEVYTPLRNPDTKAVIGVLEIYLPYEAIAAALNAGLHRLYLSLGLGLGLLYLVLAGLSGWITRRLSRHASQYRHLAMHDALTDLPNRTLFADRIAQTIAWVGRDGGGAAVVLLDLDRFREVNDTLGHHNGDLLLTCVAERLQASIRNVDTVARLGGDEFGLVLPGVTDAGQIEAALTRVMAALNQEVDLGGLPLNVEASLGVVFIPKDGLDPDLLMQHADVAMYVAKRTRGGMVCYDDAQDHYNAERLALVAELRRAIQRDELVLHYQPQVHQPSGDVRTVEALVRWQHPTRGLLAPDEFVPIAEQTGLIDDLTRWVLDRALAQLKEWRVVTPELVVAVNISARSLQHPDFPQGVLEALDRVGAAPDWLLLEITETALVTDARRAAVVLEELNRAGLKLSLDDFGQGYTSLGQLSQLPLSELKIDKSFVLNMLRNPSDAAIVRSVIELGHNLGLNVVAEGVEDAESLSTLVDLGCDIAQGYWLSRPMAADLVAPWLAAHTTEVPAQA